MRVAGLLLAAGGGTRFGGPKALAVVEGQLLVERGAAVLTAGGCEPVFVVLGAGAAEVAARAAFSGAVELVVAEDWELGLGASLRAGLTSLPAEVDACAVVLVDQPLLSSAAVGRVVAAGCQGQVARPAIATYREVPGHPVLLPRSVWDEVLATAVGDSGAREWLRIHADRVLRIACDGLGSPRDVDTAGELEGLKP